MKSVFFCALLTVQHRLSGGWGAAGVPHGISPMPGLLCRGSPSSGYLEAAGGTIGIGCRKFGWVGPEGARTTPTYMPLARTQPRGHLTLRRRGNVVHRRERGRWALASALAVGQTANIRPGCAEGSPRSVRNWNSNPGTQEGGAGVSSAAESQSSGLCWDDHPSSVPSPEARGQSQPPVKLPLKDTISTALQTGAEKCSLPPMT